MRFYFQSGNLIPAFIGLCFVAIGAYIYFDMSRFIETALETSGVVTEVIHESATPKGRIHPVVRFKTPDGREIIGSSQQHHNVRPGQTVQLLYVPDNPQQIEISTLSRARNRRNLFTILCILSGAAIAFFGLRVNFERAPI